MIPVTFLNDRLSEKKGGLPINIYDIAKQAGVSATTVSRVLNNKQNVSKKTQEKILEIMNSNNYIPNGLARGLNNNTTKTIGVMTTDIRHVHYANTAFSIEQECNAQGYSMILCNSGTDLDKKTSYLRLLAEKKVDGIIMIGSIFSDKYIETSILDNVKDIPIVFANGLIHSENIYSVLVDAAHGISLCVKHLYQKGRKQFMFLKASDTYSAKEKLKGFRKSMDECGLEYSDAHIIETDASLDGGYQAIDKLLKDKIPFDAIICSEDLIALGCISRLHNEGLQIPEDVSITGYNNSIFSQCINPNLTTVDNKVNLMGKLSFQVLFDLINGESVSSKLLITPDLIIRKST